MKKIIILALLILSGFSYSQEIKLTNERVAFSQGTFDAIVVTIPFASKESVESALKSEMKDWGGKVSSSQDQYNSIQANMKKMGDKFFDGYAKIIKEGDQIKVAFIVDLGGMYMNSREHPDQYSYIEKRAKEFAAAASKSSVKDVVKEQSKELKTLTKERKKFDKEIAKSKKNIDSYKQKIAQEEKSIADNENNIKAKDAEISEQEAKIKESKSKLKKID
ncbi:MAG TPA: hypothetical protein PLI97_06530 [Fluviicola sp.]|nr:hypothetical protein [Fluviicola sp.]